MQLHSLSFPACREWGLPVACHIHSRIHRLKNWFTVHLCWLIGGLKWSLSLVIQLLFTLCSASLLNLQSLLQENTKVDSSLCPLWCLVPFVPSHPPLFFRQYVTKGAWEAFCADCHLTPGEVTLELFTLVHCVLSLFWLFFFLPHEHSVLVS